MTALAPQLLAGRSVVLADAADAIRKALEELGAGVELFARDAERTAPVAAIVYDARSAFGQGGQSGLSQASADAWVAIREVATEAMIPEALGGKVVVITPRPDAGGFADAARAALENLTRTLSVEWARFGITATTIAPGAATTDDQIAELVCFLVSPAGDYFSGCQFSLGVTRPAA
jgi:hypothetical protein